MTLSAISNCLKCPNQDNINSSLTRLNLCRCKQVAQFYQGYYLFVRIFIKLFYWILYEKISSQQYTGEKILWYKLFNSEIVVLSPKQKNRSCILVRLASHRGWGICDFCDTYPSTWLRFWVKPNIATVIDDGCGRGFNFFIQVPRGSS